MDRNKLKTVRPILDMYARRSSIHKQVLKVHPCGMLAYCKRQLQWQISIITKHHSSGACLYQWHNIISISAYSYLPINIIIVVRKMFRENFYPDNGDGWHLAHQEMRDYMWFALLLHVDMTLCCFDSYMAEH